MEKDSSIYLLHMLDSINSIDEFLKNVSKTEFLSNRMIQSAVIREIEIIGEAVKNLPEQFKSSHNEIEWKNIIGTRDKIIHHYFGVDLNIIWDIVKKDLSVLKKQIEKIR